MMKGIVERLRIEDNRVVGVEVFFSGISCFL